MRSLSAAIVTLRLPFDTGLTIGAARAVYAPVTSANAIFDHAADVLTRWDQVPDTAGPEPKHPSDQILSFFGRWIFPESGFEIYAEWAKLFPPGLREMLVDPQRHQGFTVGAQWLSGRTSSGAVRVQAELTTLEQTPLQSFTTVPSFYTSRFVLQGYTQRGQSVGAAIGPGSSSQFLAGDYLRRSWRAGIELGRIRWEEEAYYHSPNGLFFLTHDISLFAGLRGGVTVLGLDVDGEMIATRRLNYLFQAVSPISEDRTFFRKNLTLRLRIAPR